MRKPIVHALLMLALMTGTAAYAAAEGDMAPSDKTLSDLYWRGHEALKKADWQAALERFRTLEQEMRKKDPQNADSAIYWQAYTLAQIKRTAEARAAVERLHREFPKSRWGKDADDLVRQSQATSATPNTKPSTSEDDEDITAIAVEGLMNAPPARALPLLKKVLQSNHSDKVKKRAMFVLSQIDEPGALDMLVDIAKTSNDPSLREEAIRMLGVSGDDHAVKRLGELYATSKDKGEKRAIIQAWLVSDREDLILATARNEPDPELRRSAIHTLGAMNATDALRQLFDADKDPVNRKAIVQALGVAGEVDTLAKIADSKEPDDLRIEAIHALGVAGDHGGTEALVRIYSNANSPAVREAALQGLVVAGDSGAMIELYRKAKTKEEKQELLRKITTIDSDDALQLIESELNH